MKLAPLVLLLALTATAQQTFNDPANLRGERVAPLTGRELPVDLGASGLRQMLRKLNTRASLMLIVAHPDDEDGGMLTLYSRGLGARVATLTLNRGEGGQNAMTGDFEDALGLLRTQELLSADRYFDADQMFGTEVDFGFSKTKEEAFEKWGHERVLYDAVRAVRLYRPLVIASVFVGGVTDGHGQHQVSGEIAQEVFKAAGDPKVFPELTAEGILPWQPLKVYARVPRQAITDKGLFDYATGQYAPARFVNYVTGEVTTTEPSTDVVVHEGETDSLLEGADGKPLSYVQFARTGLGLQRSQIGPGMRIPPAGRVFDIGYHLYGSTVGAAADGENVGTFFSGIDTSIMGIESLAPNAFPSDLLSNVSRAIHAANEKFDPKNPSAVAPALSAALRDVDLLIKEIEPWKGDPIQKENALHELRVKRVQLNDALVLALGLHYDATAPFRDVPVKSIVSVSTELTTTSRERAGIFSEELDATPGNSIHRDWGGDQVVTAARPWTNDLTASEAITGIETRPYFFRTDIEQPIYKLRDPALRNAPATPPALTAWVNLSFNNVDIRLGHIVDAGMQAISFVPPGSVSLLTKAQVVPLAEKSFAVTVDVRSVGRQTSVPQGLKPLASVGVNGTAEAVPLRGKESATGGKESATGGRDSAAGGKGSAAGGKGSAAGGRDSAAGGKGSAARGKGSAAGGRGSTVAAGGSGSSAAARGMDSANERVRLELPAGWSSYPVSLPLAFGAAGVPEDAIFTVTPAAMRSGSLAKIGAVAEVGGKQYREGFRSVGYPGVPVSLLFRPATERVVPVDLKLPQRRRIAYLPGTGDAVPEALASIGLKPTILSVSDLMAEKLAEFDTVILGVRTYNAHPDLHGAATRALLEYARGGGNVVVQYQTGEFTGADAPYPLTLGFGAEKVVGETDAVRLVADSSLLRVPNAITPADFNGWIEERGHGFLGSWDARYSALTEVHDPGQAPQRGGLVTATVGKGRWTYCAFALYRQLPEAVPGAWRVFMNLLDGDVR